MAYRERSFPDAGQLTEDQAAIQQARDFLEEKRAEIAKSSLFGFPKDSDIREREASCLTEVDAFLQEKKAQFLEIFEKEHGINSGREVNDCFQNFRNRVKIFFKSLCRNLEQQPISNHHDYLHAKKDRLVDTLFGDFLFLYRMTGNAKAAAYPLPFSSASSLIELAHNGNFPEDLLSLRSALRTSPQNPFEQLAARKEKWRLLHKSDWKPKHFSLDDALVGYICERNTDPAQALKDIDTTIDQLLSDPEIPQEWKTKKKSFLVHTAFKGRKTAKEFLKNVDRTCRALLLYAGESLPRGITEDTLFRLALNKRGDVRGAIEAYKELEQIVSNLFKNPWVDFVFKKNPSRVGYNVVVNKEGHLKLLEEEFCKKHSIPYEIFDALAHIFENRLKQVRVRDGKHVISLKTIRRLFASCNLTLDGISEKKLELVANSFGYSITEIAALQSSSA